MELNAEICGWSEVVLRCWNGFSGIEGAENTEWGFETILNDKYKRIQSRTDAQTKKLNLPNAKLYFSHIRNLSSNISSWPFVQIFRIFYYETDVY